MPLWLWGSTALWVGGTLLLVISGLRGCHLARCDDVRHVFGMVWGFLLALAGCVWAFW